MGSDVSILISVITGCYVQDKGFGKYLQRPLKKGSGYMVQKHVAFAPGNKWCQAPFIPKASLSSPYLRDCFVASLLATPAQPFSRFFHHTAFAKQGIRRSRALSFLMIEPAPEETSYWRLLFQEIIPGKKGNKLITFLFQVFPPSFKTIN